MTNTNNLAQEIARQLEEYAHGVGEEAERLTKEAAKAAVKKLKAQSPKDTGDYRKGWRTKKIDGYWVVYNATDWQLTHLLEDGHAKVGGGRVNPKVHIEPVRQEMLQEIVDGLANLP